MDESANARAPEAAAGPVKRCRVVSWQDPAAAAEAGAAMAGIDYLRAIAARRLPQPPMAALMGMEIEEVTPGRVVFAVVPGEVHYNTIGVAHGGLAATLLDSAMGCAVHSLLPQGRFYTTLEIKINFVKALKAQSGRVQAIGNVLHLGSNTATAEGRIVDCSGQLYAHASTTCMLLGA